MWFGNLVFQAYDQHLNMILGDVEEIVTTVEIDDETYEEIVRVCSQLASFYFFLKLSGLVELKQSRRSTGINITAPPQAPIPHPAERN